MQPTHQIRAMLAGLPPTRFRIRRADRPTACRDALRFHHPLSEVMPLSDLASGASTAGQRILLVEDSDVVRMLTVEAVSYTHLTLPTKA